MKSFEKKDSGVITANDLKSVHVKIVYWIMFGILAVISLVCLLPPLWVFVSSFKDIKEFVSNPPTIIPRSFQPEKLGAVWEKLNFMKYYLNTFILAAGDLIFCVVANGLMGYVLSRLKPKGTSMIMTLILWTMMLPTSLSTVPLFMTFIDFPIIHVNLIDTYLPMWLMAGANAFYIMLFKSFFDAIPISYIEAARLDGCSNLGIFGKIILPLSKPLLMVISIFSFNASWENFFWPYLVLKDTNMQTVAVEIYKLKVGGIAFDEFMIVLLFSIAPPVIIFIFLQKYIMTGFTLGGIKG